MMETDAWAGAFARQAKADFATWNKLQGEIQVPKCHKLQFLQMACEKLAKAHLCRTGSDPHSLQASHAYTAKILPLIARERLIRAGKKPASPQTYPLPQIRHLAREIELLAPAVDDGGNRPDNCEYPWEASPDWIIAPTEYDFPNLSLLTDVAGRIFLKLVNDAISRLA